MRTIIIREKRKKRKPETDLMRAIRDYLRLTGWFVVRFQQGLGAMPGIPDLYIIKNGRSVWVEVKMPGKILSPAQKDFFEIIRFHKGEAVTLYSIEDAQSYFRETRSVSTLPGIKPQTLA